MYSLYFCGGTEAFSNRIYYLSNVRGLPTKEVLISNFLDRLFYWQEFVYHDIQLVIVLNAQEETSLNDALILVTKSQI